MKRVLCRNFRVRIYSPTDSTRRNYRPSGDSPGAIAEGRYTFEDGEIVLSDRLGAAVREGEGKTYSQKIAEGEDPQTIAARLTRKFRQALRG
jgi:formylmethanofuran dehydrogenase subunit A